MRMQLALRFDYGFDRALGDPARGPRKPGGHRRARPGGAAHRRARCRPGPDDSGGVRGGGRRERALRADPWRRRTCRTRRRSTPSAALAETLELLDASGRSLHLQGQLAAAGPTLAAHAEGADLRADRRHRGGAHHIAARTARRHAQLGLPLLLAARRDADPAGAHAGRLLRRGAPPGATGCTAASPAAPTQIQIMYGIAGERRLAEWEVPWLPGYQGAAPVRIGNAASEPAAARRLWRGDGRAAPCPRRRAGGAAGKLGAAARHRRPSGDDLGPAGRGHLGDARRPAAFHLLQGDGLGRVRPRGHGRRDVRPARRRSTAGARCATTIHATVCREGFDAEARQLRAELRQRPNWTPAC